MWDLLIPKLNISAQKLEGCTIRTSDLDPAKNSVVIPSGNDRLRKHINLSFLDIYDAPGISNAHANKRIIYTSNGLGLTLSQYGVQTSFNTSGYVRYHNGLIIQWGYSTKTSESDYSKTAFPITFPNACLCVILTPQLSASSSTSDWGAHIEYKDQTGVWIAIHNSGSSTNASGVRFLAIGY